MTGFVATEPSRYEDNVQQSWPSKPANSTYFEHTQVRPYSFVVGYGMWWTAVDKTGRFALEAIAPDGSGGTAPMTFFQKVVEWVGKKPVDKNLSRRWLISSV